MLSFLCNASYWAVRRLGTIGTPDRNAGSKHHINRTKAHFLLVLTLLAVINNSAAATCKMVSKSGIAGKDAEKQFKFGTPDCEGFCLNTDQCIATLDGGGFCKYWTDEAHLTDAPSSSVMSVKTCSSECVMEEVADTAASNYQIEISSSSYEECKRLCAAVSSCQRFVYETTQKACNLLDTSSGTPVMKTSNFLGTKKACPDGKNCCFDILTDRYDAATSLISLKNTEDSCKELCSVFKECIGSTFSGQSCKIFTSQPVKRISPGNTLFEKNCEDGAENGKYTYSQTCESSASAISSLAAVVIFLVVNIYNKLILT